MIGVAAQVVFDVAALRNALAEQYQEQIPYAASRALNDTVTAKQDDVLLGMRRRFSIRNENFLKLSVKIPRFSNKKDDPMVVQLGIDESFAAGRADLWDKFEPGGVKVPKTSSRLAVAVAARPGKGAYIIPELRPRALNLTRGKIQKGDRRTFVATLSGGRRGILQRFGPGRHDLRLLHVFKVSVPIRAMLQFESTATADAIALFELNFEQWMQRAVASRRP